MGVILSAKEVEIQSREVFGQFGKRWQEFAKINVQLPHEDGNALNNVGLGKFLVCAAMGESLEENIDVLRKYRYRYDIVTCDKGFGILMEQGITPDYVMICDTNIPYRWLEPYVEETANIKLIATPYANIEWTNKWKGKRYYYISKDAIQTEQIFGEIFSLDPRLIPASSNVSNAMLVYFLSVDEKNQPVNWGGYEKYYLVGYDYGWRPTGKYYAFNDPKPKRYYMNQRTMLDLNGDPFLSSENLVFSAKWMYSYLTTFNMPVMNCSRRGILDYTRLSVLEDELKKINPNKSLGKELKRLHTVAEGHKINFDTSLNDFMKFKSKLYN
ncbi:MAG: 6-hydroxymethylpterin diphosphokinase MptE-like protein [Thermodesulfobacteriota bacterium]|nr:6-hydroxymethylpterin diphosphokinase MptE-like protein [Thermodesulfobacteriota bacterium]